MKLITKQSHFNKLIGFGVPILLFWVFFQFYNFGRVNPSEMVKTTGLVAISLLSLTLVIGPICRIIPPVEFLKVYRKVWGILSFVVAATHVGLVYVFFYKFNLLKFVDFSNPKYGGIMSGLLALTILLLVTLTSNQKVINKLSPSQWKIIQTTSYLALILAVFHFYLMEQVDGTLIIRRTLGQITYVLAILVIIFRVLILLLPSKK